jgi:hypothetical protein
MKGIECKEGREGTLMEGEDEGGGEVSFRAASIDWPASLLRKNSNKIA